MNTDVIAQKFFKDKQNNVYCIDVMPMNQNTWESEIKPEFIAISKAEAMKIANPKLTKEQHVLIAEEKKQQLIDEANQKTQMWQTQLMLGIITDEDKASLTEWMLYVQKVQAVDTSTAPDIIWPEKPE